MTFAAKQTINNVPAIQLPDREQVQACYEERKEASNQQRIVHHLVWNGNTRRILSNKLGEKHEQQALPKLNVYCIGMLFQVFFRIYMICIIQSVFLVVVVKLKDIFWRR